jgi:hypothetical protein
LDGDQHIHLDPHGNSSRDRDDNRHPYADAFENFYDFQYADENRHEHGNLDGDFDEHDGFVRLCTGFRTDLRGGR